MSESLTGQQRFYCISSDLCVLDILRLFIFHFIYFNAPEVFQPQVLVSFFKHQLNCRLKEDLGEKIRPSKVRLPLTLLPYNHDLAAINQNRSSQLTCNCILLVFSLVDCPFLHLDRTLREQRLSHSTLQPMPSIVYVTQKENSIC